MFLDTMSPEAIIKEARRDTTAIQNKRDFFINTHRREILFMYLRSLSCQALLPQHFLNFFPEPQGQGSLRPNCGRVPSI